MGFTFQYFENLTALNLGYNLIQIIEKNAFHGLHLLQRLHLEHNSLQVLPIGMFNKLNCLQDLSIEHNKLQSRQDDQMKETSKILSLRTLSFDIHPDFKFPSEWSTLSHLNNLNIYARSTKVQFNKEMFAHIGTIQITSLHLNLVPSISEDSITVQVSDDLPKNPISQVFRSFAVVKSGNMTNIEIAYSRIDY
ncbi:unnamed protein product [Mytilus coruscus]|uniref:Uncharacterized protein n=1 Tax=Mytilus coruscus TaxID=42192 RepID=A0A6J8CRG7_MYTCO|nr:unnamed protein product [Mytilus coruscus]